MPSAGHRCAANDAASETPSLRPETVWTRSAVGSPLRSATTSTRATVAAFRAAWAVSRRIAVTSRACAASSGEAAASRLLAFGSALTGMITVHCTLASVDYPHETLRVSAGPAHQVALARPLPARTNASDVYVNPHRGVAGVAQNDTFEYWYVIVITAVDQDDVTVVDELVVRRITSAHPAYGPSTET